MPVHISLSSCSSRLLLVSSLIALSSSGAFAQDNREAADFAPVYTGIQTLLPVDDGLAPTNVDLFFDSAVPGEAVSLAVCNAETDEACVMQDVEVETYPCNLGHSCLMRYDPGELAGQTPYTVDIDYGGELRSSTFTTANFADDDVPNTPVLRGIEVNDNEYDGEISWLYLNFDVDASTISTDAVAVLFYETSTTPVLDSAMIVFTQGNGDRFIWGSLNAPEQAEQRCYALSVLDLAGNESQRSDAVCVTLPAASVNPFAGCGDNRNPQPGEPVPLAALSLIGLAGAGLRRRRRG